MDPNDILRPSDWEFYRHAQRWEKHPEVPRSPEELTKDANIAHDNLKELVAERDRLQKVVLVLNARTVWLVRLVIASNVIWASAFFYVFRWAAPWIVKGMMK
jgi:hypothetical protein